MKNLYLFLAFTISVLLHFISFSQCEIAGGDFENLQDISSELVEEGFFDFCTDSMIIGSPQFSSLGRVTLLSFAESFGALEGVSCQQIYGMYPHDTGANGTASALKLQTDTILNLADAVSVIPCDTLPKLLKGSVLHVGSELDTADVVIAINYSFARGTADLSGILRIAGGSDEFTEFEIPVEIKDEEIEVNTVSIFLIVESDEDHLEAGNESYYVFDELELVYNDPVSSVSDNEIYNFTMSPNPVGKDFRLTKKLIKL